MKKRLLLSLILIINTGIATVAFGQTKPDTAAAPEEEGEIFLKIKPNSKDAIYKEPGNIVYAINIKSTYKVAQEGTVSYVLVTDLGKSVHTESVKVKISPKGSQSLKFNIPAKNAGFYDISFRFNLSYYDDTVRRVFGLDPDKITAGHNKPDDFDVFWQNSLDSLKKIPPKFEVTEQSNMSNDKVKVYLVQMRSWGNAIIRGWLTIPIKRPKKLPIRYRVPAYLVPMLPTTNENDFAVFSINVRGNGNSKDAINTRGIQYNLYNIENRNKYIYRAVYMDCIRGLDFVASIPEMGLDTSRISVDGGSQGGALALVVAALDKRIKLVTSQVPLYSDIRNATLISKTMFPHVQTPVWFLNNYVKQNPGFTERRLFQTWDYFDPLNFANMIHCPVLMGIGLLDEHCPPACSLALFNRLATQKKVIWINPDKTHEVDGNYYRFQYQWLREYFLLP